MSPSFLSALGIKLSSKFTNTVELSLTKTESEKKIEDFKLDLSIPLRIPPWSERIILYSDSKRKAAIPVTINATVDGDLVLTEYLDRTGVYWHSKLVTKLWNKYPVKERTFEVDFVINAQGSDRSLKIKQLGRKLKPDDYECMNKTISMKANKVPVKEKLYDIIKDETKDQRIRECQASAKLQSHDQNGNSASAIFQVSVEPSCKRHSGEIEFVSIARKWEDEKYSIRQLIMRDNWEIWSHEEESDFLVKWEDFVHLDDDEELIDIEDIEIGRCDCDVWE